MIRLAAIASVDLAAARCTVQFDDGIESGPVRWIEGRMGSTSIWSPPTIGEQVVLLCPAGEIAAGVVLRGLACDAFAPPSNAALDLMRFGDGAVLSYDADAHALVVNLPAGSTVAITADGGVTVNGPVTINGDFQVNGAITATGDVQAGSISLQSHVHTGVQSGSSNTGGPQ